MQWRLIVSLVIALIVIIFTFQNPAPVQMRFMAWQSGHIPFPVTIMISMLIGAVGSLILGIKQMGKLKKKIRRLEAEIEDLRTPPISADDEEE